MLVSVADCNACRVRASKGLDGECPACANERARKAAGRPSPRIVHFHVETPGGEVVVSGQVTLNRDVRSSDVIARLETDAYPFVTIGATDFEALEALATKLERAAARIREKAMEDT